jgi:glycosyl transferase, family 25
MLNNMIKIFVISLPNSLDRRAKVIEKLSSKNISFEFLDAVDGRIDNHPYLKNYNENSYLLNRNRKAAPGELGCYVSHLLAWEKCVQLNEPIVVLEDDFELTEDFVEGLLFVEQYLDKVSFIRLEKLKSNFHVNSSYKGDKFILAKQLKVGMCTTGYVITPKCSKVLLSKGREICAPVDLFLRQTLKHKQLIYALIPHIVYPTHIDSIIGFEIRTKKEKGAILKIKRFFHKWTYTIGDVVINLLNAYVRF